MWWTYSCSLHLIWRLPQHVRDVMGFEVQPVSLHQDLSTAMSHTPFWLCNTLLGCVTWLSTKAMLGMHLDQPDGRAVACSQVPPAQNPASQLQGSGGALRVHPAGNSPVCSPEALHAININAPVLVSIPGRGLGSHKPFCACRCCRPSILQQRRSGLSTWILD